MGASEASEPGSEAPKEVPARTFLGQHFLSASRRFLVQEYPAKIDAALAHLAVEDLWWRPHADQNSIANLLLHLAGNVRQWIVSGVGGHPDQRDRAAEFATRPDSPAAGDFDRIRAALAASLLDADRVLESLDPHHLEEPRSIQGLETTVFEAIYHVVEHFSMHTGQVLYIAKLRSGRDLGFYEVDDDGRVSGLNW